MLQVLARHGVNIIEALIDTVGHVARDVFYVTDADKRKITDERRWKEIEQAIVEALRPG